jgi:hypoxia up-regulated 1
MLAKFQEKHPKLADGVASNPRALRKLLSQAQKTKLVLSSNKNAAFTVESLYDDTDFQTSILREDFEDMCRDMLSKLTDPVEKALASANLTGADITQIEVVGGAWRVPKVQQVLNEYFEAKKGSKLVLGQHLNGEEASALGAALVGANSSTSFRVKKIFFADITMHEYAVQVASLTGEWEKNYTVLYPVGAPMGGKKKLAFSLEEDFVLRLFEDGVLVAVYEVTGLKGLLAEKWSTYNMTGLPKITVSVLLESSGIITVKTPLATVEEAHWVNVTREKPKPVVNASNATNSSENSSANSDSAEEEPKATEEAETSDEAKTADGTDETTNDTSSANGTNSTNGTNATEYETIEKLKKKKHEKKLNVTRIDFKPIPMSASAIEEATKLLENMTAKEQEVKAVQGLKNELEAQIYSSRDKLESEDVIKVSTEEQREEVTKLCTEYEEWMYEAGATKNDYDTRLAKLNDLLGPIQERAIELEARADIPGAVKEIVDAAKDMQSFIEKNMSWVNASKTAAAVEKLTEFEEWWAKRQTAQAVLPLHEAPAYTKSDVMDRVNKVSKEFTNLKKN